MSMLLSELYGKEIITNTGKKIGMVEDIILDFEKTAIANLLLTRIDDLVRAQNTASVLAKNSVRYERVRSISETIIISTEK